MNHSQCHPSTTLILVAHEKEIMVRTIKLGHPQNLVEIFLGWPCHLDGKDHSILSLLLKTQQWGDKCYFLGQLKMIHPIFLC
jgi:hypothetical protein